MLCDLAEFYHIYRYKDFPMEYIATLVTGLPSQSRVIKRVNNLGYSTEELLLANIVDRLSLIWWSKTSDGQKNRNRPKLITSAIVEQKEKSNNTSFDSVDEFEKKREELKEKKSHGRR